jgi:hypothetical protein
MSICGNMDVRAEVQPTHMNPLIYGYPARRFCGTSTTLSMHGSVEHPKLLRYIEPRRPSDLRIRVGKIPKLLRYIEPRQPSDLRNPCGEDTYLWRGGPILVSFAAKRVAAKRDLPPN